MEQFLLHPKVVHLPIALAVLMPLIAGGLALARWRGWLPKRAWIVAVALQGVLVASGFVALETGETDEERVETVVDEAYIDTHEDLAETFVWAGLAVFGLFLAAGAIRKENVSLGLAAAATIGTLVILGLGYRVGETGGSLVYEHGAANAHITSATGSQTPLMPRPEHDDDD